jgi:hypothetical protein
MPSEALMTRLICSQGNVDQQKFRVGHLNEDEMSRLKKAAADIYDAPLYIDDSSNTTLMDIKAKVKKLATQIKRDHGAPLGLVIVDYLQLMSAPNMGRNSNRVQEVSALSRGLKLMSKDLDVPFLVLSQLSRAPDQRQGDHRPLLSDLRESGSIEQDADIVNFIFRPEEYNKEQREDLRGQAELIIAKQRNGPTGKVPLLFIHEFTRVRESGATRRGPARVAPQCAGPSRIRVPAAVSLKPAILVIWVVFWPAARQRTVPSRAVQSGGGLQRQCIARVVEFERNTAYGRRGTETNRGCGGGAASGRAGLGARAGRRSRALASGRRFA